MSDHESGPRAVADPSVDITDLYVFPSPDKPGSLVLILDVFPNAGPTALFSDAVDYRVRLRPVQIPSPGTTAFSVGEHEYVFSCRFDVPIQGKAGAELLQEGTCTASTGQSASFVVNDEQGGRSQGLHVFAGRRMDPFFFDGVRAAQTVMTGHLAFVNPGSSRQYRQNVLSIVMVVDIGSVFRSEDLPFLAVVAETATIGSITLRFERFGRPLIKSVALAMKNLDPVNRDLEIRDLYNQEDAFHLGTSYIGAFKSRLNANLAFWDRLDGKVDWPAEPDGAHPLTSLLLADFMVVDISKPYAENSYLEIERALLKGGSNQTCGGRSPNDDIADTYLTVLVNAGSGPRISDGVDQQAVQASRSFPYLAPPELNPPPKTEVSLGPPK
jgi:uncharacterized protein DUF4331